MRAEVLTITPKTAKEYLNRNQNYRTVSQQRVDDYARAMAAGAWEVNMQPIVFNLDDELVNGQHRLMACMKAGKPFTSLVVWGAREAEEMDRGAPRTFHDWLRRHGYKNIRTLASITRTYWQHTQGKSPASIVTHKGRASITELAAVIKRHKGLIDSMERIGSNNSTPYLRFPTLFAALHYAFRKKDHVMANEFIAGVKGQVPLNNNDPVKLLRDLLIRDMNADERYSKGYLAALIITVWNAWRDGRTMQKLVFRGTGPKAQAFPTIK
jgi:hypothetical protein